MSRKEKKYHFIYKTTNLLSGKYYIGMHSTDNLDDGYLGSGKRLRYSINKHGAENHVREILEFVDSREELKKREKEIVSLDEIAKEECMNLMVGGQGGIINNEHLENFVKAGINNFNKTFNKRHASLKEKRQDDEWVKNVGLKITESLSLYYKENENAFKNCTHSSKTKELISSKLKGKRKGEHNSQYGTCWITRSGENKKIKKEEIDSYLIKGWEKGRR